MGDPALADACCLARAEAACCERLATGLAIVGQLTFLVC